jgi:transposase
LDNSEFRFVVGISLPAHGEKFASAGRRNPYGFDIAESLRVAGEHQIFFAGSLRLKEQIRSEATLTRVVRLLARVIGVGIETADMLVQEVLARNMRDRRALARYGGLTGSPDESGTKRREKGLARSGNARVRRGMIQLAWRFLMFQKESALAQWFRARTQTARGTRKTMIVALARKLLIALWRLVREGVVPDGVVLRPAQ